MPRPGFYNDNEYRAYPFVYQPRTQTEPTLAESSIVDAGFIMGLDADFDEAADAIWLASISRTESTVTFTFNTDAVGASTVPLIFTRNTAAEEWLTEYAQTDPANLPCAEEPIWEGFLVTGVLTQLANQLSDGQTITFTKNEYRVEPGRIQNLAKSYLRSITLGNYERTAVPECNTNRSDVRPIILNAACIKGDVKLKEGYQCQITQNTRTNTIDISAGVTAGAEKDDAFCENGSELPLFPGETIPENSKFYSSSPACDELIFTINGIGGKNISLLGGNGITITTTDANQLKLTFNANTQNACPPPPAEPLP